MTSNEAVELAILEYEKETIDDENNQWVKNVLKGLKEVKQDLDLLQGFKDNHHSMEKRNIELTTENEKLKKVIEILKDKTIIIFALKLSKDLNDYNRMTSFENLTQEEYDLLKEYVHE